MNKEINYEMIIVDKSVNSDCSRIATNKYNELRTNSKQVVLVTQLGDKCSVLTGQSEDDFSIFAFTVPDTLSTETDLLTFIADKVELLIGTLFDEGTTFNLEALYYYND